MNMKANSHDYEPPSVQTRLLALNRVWAVGSRRAKYSAGEAPYYRDLFSDTWVGHDALGRNMPTYSVVGPVKKDHRRVVGIFYITWHSDSAHKA